MKKPKITRRTKWEKKLTIKEIRHIRETTDTGSLQQFIHNRELQRAMNTPCHECRFIARKLGLEE
jgi:hypothetical protein